MGGQSQLITHRRAGRLWKIYAHRDPFRGSVLVQLLGSQNRGYGLQPNLGAGFFQKPEKQSSASPIMLGVESSDFLEFKYLNADVVRRFGSLQHRYDASSTSFFGAFIIFYIF
jgi:hypothetical protein